MQYATTTRNRLAWARRLANELRSRKVGRTASAYILVTWLVVQLADIAFPLMQLPDSAMEILIVLAAAGFPVSVVLAWLFELTPHGVVVDSRDGSNADRIVANTILLVLSTLLACILAYAFVQTRTDVHEVRAPSCPIELAQSERHEPLVSDQG